MSKSARVPALTTLSHVRKGPKWTFNGRYDNSNIEQSGPGPGQYVNPSAMGSSRKAPGCVFGLTERGYEKAAEVPGPGSYCPEKAKKAPSFSCTPRRYLKGSEADVPGPGAHDLPGLVGNGPKYGFTHDDIRPTSGAREVTQPGPGTYSIAEKTSPTGWKMGTSLRDPQPQQETPGPGTYKIASSLGGPKFSAAPRREESRVEETPGPVTYKLQSTIGKAQSYSMGSRKENSRWGVHDEPGPGHYSARLPPGHSPRFVFSTVARTHSAAPSRLPGPGTYTPVVKRDAHKYKFGSDKRESKVYMDQPGPGSYNVVVSARKNGPKYSLGCRYDEPRQNKTSDPGPGEYNQDSTACASKPSPRWGFGSSVRLAMSDRGFGPGPGTYAAPPKTFSGPKFGFPRSKRKPLSETDTPGPGTHGGAATQFT